MRETEIPDRVVRLIARALFECDVTRELASDSVPQDEPPDTLRWSRLTPAERRAYDQMVWNVVIRGLSLKDAWGRWKAWNEPLEATITEREHFSLFADRYAVVKSVGAALVTGYRAAITRGAARATARRRRRRRPVEVEAEAEAAE